MGPPPELADGGATIDLFTLWLPLAGFEAQVGRVKVWAGAFTFCWVSIEL